MKRRLMRAAAALALGLTAIGVAAGGGLAQEYLGSAVTVGGDVTGIENGQVVVLAPGVTISGGDVVNATGIGVDSGGGSSIGASTGGDTNAALSE
jgi:hypothetical protein